MSFKYEYVMYRKGTSSFVANAVFGATLIIDKDN